MARMSRVADGSDAAAASTAAQHSAVVPRDADGCRFQSTERIALLLLQLLNRSLELLDLLLGFFTSNAVALLNCAKQLVALAGDAVEVVVRQLAPLLAEFAG